MKIKLKKSKLHNLIKQEINNVLFEQQRSKKRRKMYPNKVPEGWLVKEQRDGRTYPIIQKFWDRKTAQLMESINNLISRQGGKWYQTKDADAEDFEIAYQEFLQMKWFWETFNRIQGKRKKHFEKMHAPLKEWSFEENYGLGDPESKEEHPFYITKITVEKSDLIKGGVNPRLFFNDGTDVVIKTPERRLTAANATKKAWKNSVLVFDGFELSWRIGGLGGEPFDSGSPIGGPWKAGSGTIGDYGAFVNWFRGLDRGREQQKWNRKQAESDGRAGPIPEGWYTVGGSKMQSVPKELLGDMGNSAAVEYWNLDDDIKKKLVKKFDPDFGRNFYKKNKKLDKGLLKWERIWRNAAWGRHRIAIHGGGKGTSKTGPDGKRVKNLAQIYKRDYFYIHGGAARTSSGCIDLSDEMPQFHEFWVKKWLQAGRPGEKISLYVNYRDKDMEKISKLVSQSEFRNKETETLPKDSPKVKAAAGGDASWEVPASHMRKVVGCRGGNPVAGSLRWSSKEFYKVIERAIPSELLSQDRFKGWNVGKPGKKSRLLVAMLQMKLFNGDLEQVDGCFGQGTYNKLNEK